MSVSHNRWHPYRIHNASVRVLSGLIHHIHHHYIPQPHLFSAQRFRLEQGWQTTALGNGQVSWSRVSSIWIIISINIMFAI